MLYPVNRFLVVEVLAEQKKEYKQERSVYSLVTLLKAGPESEFKFGSKLVVPTHMVEELNIFGEKHCVVLENHVVGILDN